MRFILVIGLVIASHLLIAQTNAFDPTSATHKDVKVHKHRNFFHFKSNRKKKRIQKLQPTERPVISAKKHKAIIKRQHIRKRNRLPITDSSRQ
jgi:hypothetical protein